MQYFYWLIIVTRPCDQLTFLPNGDLTLLSRRKHDFYILLLSCTRPRESLAKSFVFHPSSHRNETFEQSTFLWNFTDILITFPMTALKCYHASKKERAWAFMLSGCLSAVHGFLPKVLVIECVVVRLSKSLSLTLSLRWRWLCLCFGFPGTGHCSFVIVLVFVARSGELTLMQTKIASTFDIQPWVQCSVLFVSTSCAFNDVCFGNIIGILFLFCKILYCKQWK